MGLIFGLFDLFSLGEFVFGLVPGVDINCTFFCSVNFVMGVTGLFVNAGDAGDVGRKFEPLTCLKFLELSIRKF